MKRKLMSLIVLGVTITSLGLLIYTYNEINFNLCCEKNNTKVAKNNNDQTKKSNEKKDESEKIDSKSTQIKDEKKDDSNLNQEDKVVGKNQCDRENEQKAEQLKEKSKENNITENNEYKKADVYEDQKSNEDKILSKDKEINENKKINQNNDMVFKVSKNEIKDNITFLEKIQVLNILKGKLSNEDYKKIEGYMSSKEDKKAVVGVLNILKQRLSNKEYEKIIKIASRFINLDAVKG